MSKKWQEYQHRAVIHAGPFGLHALWVVETSSLHNAVADTGGIIDAYHGIGDWPRYQGLWLWGAVGQTADGFVDTCWVWPSPYEAECIIRARYDELNRLPTFEGTLADALGGAARLFARGLVQGKLKGE